MAAEARVTPPKHANPERQELINSLHQRMLDMEDRSRSMSKQMPPADVPQAEEAQDLKSEEGLVQEDSCCSAQPLAEQSSAAAAEESPAEGRQIAAQAVVEATPVTSPAPVSPVAPQPRSPPLHVAAHTPPPLPSQQPAAQPPVPQEELFATPVAHPEPATPPQATSATPIGAYETPMAVGEHGGHVQSSWEDRGLTFLAVLLAALIAAMLLRRVILSLRPHEADGLFSVNPMGDIEL